MTIHFKAGTKQVGPAKGLWPVLLISYCGTLVYLPVILEHRYVASFVAMLFPVILFAIVPENVTARNRSTHVSNSAAMAWILTIGCTLNLLANEKDVVRDLLGSATIST